jgi:hypothetical protein
VATRAQNTMACDDRHIVKFYEDEGELAQTVGDYLANALGSGQTAVVVASATHRLAFEAELRARGMDLARAARAGRLLWPDAQAVLASFTRSGEIEPGAFRHSIEGLLRAARESGRELCVYGEMVALLWQSGDVLGAIELERLWNELAAELSFSLLCAYPAISRTSLEHAGALLEICELHTSVLGWASAPAGNEPAASYGRLTASYPAEHASPGRARRLAARTLREWGYEGTVVDDVVLVLSELANNAVLHARSAFSIELRLLGSMLRVAVRDSLPPGGEMMLVVRPTHGLAFIDAVCIRRGLDGDGEGKTVWAELPCGYPALRAV